MKFEGGLLCKSQFGKDTEVGRENEEVGRQAKSQFGKVEDCRDWLEKGKLDLSHSQIKNISLIFYKRPQTVPLQLIDMFNQRKFTKSTLLFL